MIDRWYISVGLWFKNAGYLWDGTNRGKARWRGQLLSKYKLCAESCKSHELLCDKGSKNCWWVALQEVPGTSQRWAKDGAGMESNRSSVIIRFSQSRRSTCPLFSPSPSHSVDRHPEIGGRWWNKAEQRKEERIPPPVWGLECQTLGVSHFLPIQGSLRPIPAPTTLWGS